CQEPMPLTIALAEGDWSVGLPFAPGLAPFDTVEQHLSMTSVRFVCHSLRLGIRADIRIVAPFWPQDEAVSCAPVYLVDAVLEPVRRIRWTGVPKECPHRAVLRLGLRPPNADLEQTPEEIVFRYPVQAAGRFSTGEGVTDTARGARLRRQPTTGQAEDRLLPLVGAWRIEAGELRCDVDVHDGTPVHLRAALAGFCGDPLFERFGEAMRLRYTDHWQTPRTLAAAVRREHENWAAKSRRFDALFGDSDLPAAALDTLALAFQSYLICTLWCVPAAASERLPRQWFSVWEGSCWYNSTVDVTCNEAPFYFAFWPQLLERIFAEWQHHANDAPAERRRCADLAAGSGHPPAAVEDFPGAILEHDMGAGWCANGQSYHHAMPVEENANFLLLLFAHGRWWGREGLFETYRALNRSLTEYLLWADSTGNGFPDRGTANTIDDASPAVQYGRDNVYLGVKRLAALHAARRMFEAVGDTAFAQRCAAEVRRAVRTLNEGWLEDHWGVCLDPTTAGLVDAWSGKPLPYEELPGWDAYSLYTSNGLLPLLMVGDLPEGLDLERLRQDLLRAEKECRTAYGSGHSSEDRENVWISMNMWRDAVAGYLGMDMLENAERYWALQTFANGAGAEKANGFSETTLRNNLVLYPRGAAGFAWIFGLRRLVRDLAAGKVSQAPLRRGDLPPIPWRIDPQAWDD
ncbi:MAG: DUF4965 domain-containing protein, partial [Lentisphaeria bacterium]|nr:DUF4965 domain-containing protein [Lentisphaeria bacterium]